MYRIRKRKSLAYQFAPFYRFWSWKESSEVLMPVYFRLYVLFTEIWVNMDLLPILFADTEQSKYENFNDDRHNGFHSTLTASLSFICETLVPENISLYLFASNVWIGIRFLGFKVATILFSAI